ncbi:MAG: hypothetical protein JWM35_107 [Verrucomicrobia bacterium]|nr:hypothetical protein [Verrucomicrobiota bacterium]
MKHSPEDLEKLIHETLRSAPLHRAPRSLESRVMAAIEARAALPWWKQSFARWPMAARVAFFVASAGLAKVALMALVWAMAGFDGAQFANAFGTQVAWIESISATFSEISGICSAIYRNIPPLWLYGGLAFLATMYAAMFGLGAAAYRTLYSRR